MAATPSSERAPDCPLCATPGGEEVWRDDRLRVIFAEEPGYPGFTRVVWHAHRAEMTDLDSADRAHLMGVVWQVELVMRAMLRPDKINLASLGNQVPHLHWHVIPRWRDDPHFPQSVWSARAGGRQASAQGALTSDVAAYRARLRAVLAAPADVRQVTTPAPSSVPDPFLSDDPERGS